MNILKLLINEIKNLDKKIKKIMNDGFIFSSIITLISIFLLLTYSFFYSIPLLFYIGFSLFRTSLIFICTFFICGIGFNTIKKEII